MGTALRPDADVAVWDVGSRTRWHPHLGATIDGIDLQYEPWDESGAWWCPTITLRLSTGNVVVTLGEALPDGTLGPSANNVAVLLSPEDCPDPLP